MNPKPGGALVIGYGLSGRAATKWLVGRGWEVTVVDDDPSLAGLVSSDDLGDQVRFVLAPPAGTVASLASGASLVVPSPGVAVDHPGLSAAEAAGAKIASEVELGWYELEERRRKGASCRLVALTGTNGKTTVARLVAAMLSEEGIDARLAGNVGYPFLEAAAKLEGPGPYVVVAEVSSFQLHYSSSFRPDVSCWLNFSPDHLDWHPDLRHYALAKAKIWVNQGPGSVAVVNASDPVVMEMAAAVPLGVKVVSFGLAEAGPHWSAYADCVVGPDGSKVLAAAELPRALPHDLMNTAAAFAVATEAGAGLAACARAARATAPPPHRVQLVAKAGGISWYDDSKATTPASVRAAVSGFASVVLIAGGRNKGLDLSPLSLTVPPVHHVVAIGESSSEVARIFEPLVPVCRAGSMAEAVELASAAARPGDAVVLSPGCASFDWYSSYAERGDDFAALVRKKLEGPQMCPAQPGKS
jgi:UDP-N-acetylmuramoylalanine--D-glutamate ligase